MTTHETDHRVNRSKPVTFARRRAALADLFISRTLGGEPSRDARGALGRACRANTDAPTKRAAEATLARIVIRYLRERVPAPHEPVAKHLKTIDRLADSAMRALDHARADAVLDAVDGMRMRWAAVASRKPK